METLGLYRAPLWSYGRKTRLAAHEEAPASAAIT
jgi:hypothetical protein